MPKKQISPKTISLIFGILVICFLTVFYILAWTEPTSSPPDGNVAAPLNTSGTSQTKTGWLAFPVFYDSTDYPSYFIDPQGEAASGASVKVKGYIQAEGGYKSSDGSTGLTNTATFIVKDENGHETTCTITIKNGLITAVNCQY